MMTVVIMLRVGFPMAVFIVVTVFMAICWFIVGCIVIVGRGRNDFIIRLWNFVVFIIVGICVIVCWLGIWISFTKSF